MARISIIVPVYKVEPYLHKCVDSVLAQTFTDFELILVDDGSPDNCGRICDEYAEKDSRVRVIHQENGGLSAARNVGLDWVFTNNNSDWITFIDSDDYVSPHYLEILYSAALVENSDLIISGFLCVDENGNETAGSLKYGNATYDKQTAFNLLSIGTISVISCAKLYNNNIFKNIRFPIGNLHEDEYVIHYLLWECSRISLISDQLYYYVQRDTSIMNSKKLVNYLDALESYIDRYYFYKKNNMPFNYAILVPQYYYASRYKTKISDKEKNRFDKLEKEYNEIIASNINNKLKRKMWVLKKEIHIELYEIKKKMMKYF